MTPTHRQWLSWGFIGLGSAAALFNLFQMIIIISGKYNRNESIESPLLQTLDAIALTGLWLLVSVVIVCIGIFGLRQSIQT